MRPSAEGTSRLPLDILEELLESSPDISPKQLGELIKLDEGQYHEFKSGTILSDLRKAKRILRKYAVGFANADGGALFLGITDKAPRVMDGVTPHIGTASIVDWAQRVLANISEQTGFGIRVHLLDHDGKKVLAVIRAAVPSRWSAKVEELRSLLASNPALSLSTFLEKTGLELEDVYAGDKSSLPPTLCRRRHRHHRARGCPRAHLRSARGRPDRA